MAVAVVAFFLPWATVDLGEPGVARYLKQTAQGSLDATGGQQAFLDRLAKKIGRVRVEVRRGTETIAGDLPSLSDIPREISGSQIPHVVNQEQARVATALFEMFTNSRQHLGLKSYAVYLVPGIALLLGLLLTFLGERSVPVALGVALCCSGIAGAGFWKLLTTRSEALFVAITIGTGLWWSLWAYVGLAMSAVWIVALGRRRT
jgi:hypothetical protein